ncbi:hypothetical protein ABZ820_33765 [Streptomyces diacarni]|uniref:hypothetical protein n=1 Tax=Streptomyces diacarni TaxID=2800381 RepID=UPI0033C6FFDD
MLKYATKYSQTHPNRVVTHGSTEPVVTALELGGFEIRDLFLCGFNPDCGSVIVDSQERARAAAAAREPGYATKITHTPEFGDWCVDYNRREMDGSERSRFITDIVLNDGTVAMKDGRRTR